MTNDETRRNTEIPMPKQSISSLRLVRGSGFGFLLAFVIRHWSFGQFVARMHLKTTKEKSP
jgi:hypothetical protein